MAAREAAKSAKTLDELRDILSKFEGCALKRTAKNTVFADGTLGASTFNDYDMFVARYSKTGVRRWLQQIGTSGEDYTGDVAVVLEIHAPDPHRPRVRVVAAADGRHLETPYECDLWAAQEGQATAIQTPLDPAEFGIDPLAQL